MTKDFNGIRCFFVPNLTFGPVVVESLRKISPKTFDVHLMISLVDSFIEGFALAGADIISFHPEPLYITT